MKCKFILSIAACGASLAISPCLRAQDAAPAPATTGTTSETTGPGGHHHGGGEMIQRLTTALNLTPDQQTQIKPILETFHTQRQTIMQDTTLEPKDKMAKMRDARETMNTQIKAILTPDQQAKFAQMMENMRNHRRGAGGPGAPVSASTPAATPSATP